MEKKDIENRADVHLLVSTFYNKIKKDAFIGHFFIRAIPANQWEAHINKLTDFWETNLFLKKKYKGNPMQVHQQLDVGNNFEITQEHFGRWLELWLTTIKELFYGDKAEKAINSARNISFMLFLRMFENRKFNKVDK